MPALIRKNPLAVLPVLVVLFWVLCFLSITSSFSNLTLESERKANLFATQPDLLMHLVDDNGQIFTLTALAKQQNKTLVTQFMYTQCKTLCLTLGDYFQQAQTAIETQNLAKKIHLVSISFDVEEDNPTRLKNYRQRMHADKNIWSLATMQSTHDLTAAKKNLGLIILKTQSKDYVHNSAFLVISNQGKLLGIYDDDDIQGALALAVKQS